MLILAEKVCACSLTLTALMGQSAGAGMFPRRELNPLEALTKQKMELEVFPPTFYKKPSKKQNRNCSFAIFWLLTRWHSLASLDCLSVVFFLFFFVSPPLVFKQFGRIINFQIPSLVFLSGMVSMCQKHLHVVS